MHPVDLVAGTAEGVVLEAPPREYTRREFLTTIWKTGNFLRTLGVHEESRVVVTPHATPESLLALFGASLLDARIRFASSGRVDARVVVGPTDEIDGFDLPAGGQFVGYGDRPADPTWSYFEREVWSENPTFPAVEHDPDVVFVETAETRHTSADVVAAARRVAASYEPEDVVAVRTSLSNPGTVVAGVLAPFVADATVLLLTEDATGTVAVTNGDAPESRTVDPGVFPG